MKSGSALAIVAIVVGVAGGYYYFVYRKQYHGKPGQVASEKDLPKDYDRSKDPASGLSDMIDNALSTNYSRAYAAGRVRRRSINDRFSKVVKSRN